MISRDDLEALEKREYFNITACFNFCCLWRLPSVLIIQTINRGRKNREMLKTDYKQKEEESIMKITFTSAFLHQGKGSNRDCKYVLQSEPRQSLWADTWIGCSRKMNLLSIQHAPRNRLWNTSFADIFFPPAWKDRADLNVEDWLIKYTWNIETKREDFGLNCLTFEVQDVSLFIMMICFSSSPRRGSPDCSIFFLVFFFYQDDTDGEFRLIFRYH